MSKLLRWLMQWVNVAIYVWSATGENVLVQMIDDAYNPEGWIKANETSAAKANTAIALFRDRMAEGLNPVIAFDCSGLVTCLLRYLGIIKPNARYNTKGLYAKCNSHPKREELREGDLVFYSKSGKEEDITHVGVYVGDGKVIEAKGRAYGVVKTDIKDYPWNMYGRIDAIAPFTVPYQPEPVMYDVTKPCHEGEAYRLMQSALNAGCYTDDEGKMLTVDGKWGKRSRQAFDRMMRLNAAEGGNPVPHSVTVEIDGCVVAETMVSFD